MQTDWIWGFGGGLLIGLAASGYLLLNGRIMGISGIYGGLVDRSGWSDWVDRLAFIAGLVAVPWLMTRLVPSTTHLTGNWAVIVLGGLLVGLGTRLANGCTSGHGVCGISRLSLRGIVATVFYVLAGGLTMALMRHVLGVI
ncbi:YeeE/YedE family protein [bacterium]|nr:YeeE/YedE family protein [bacterium]